MLTAVESVATLLWENAGHLDLRMRGSSKFLNQLVSRSELQINGASVNIPLGRTLLCDGSCFPGGELDTSIGIFAVVTLNLCVVFAKDFCKMRDSVFTRYAKVRFTGCAIFKGG